MNEKTIREFLGRYRKANREIRDRPSPIISREDAQVEDWILDNPPQEKPSVLDQIIENCPEGAYNLLINPDNLTIGRTEAALNRDTSFEDFLMDQEQEKKVTPEKAAYAFRQIDSAKENDWARDVLERYFKDIENAENSKKEN